MLEKNIGLTDERQQVPGVLAFQHVDVARAHPGEIGLRHLALVGAALAEQHLARLNKLVKVVPSATLPQVRMRRSPDSICSSPTNRS